jgi:hypothetical protein
MRERQFALYGRRRALYHRMEQKWHKERLWQKMRQCSIDIAPFTWKQETTETPETPEMKKGIKKKEEEDEEEEEEEKTSGVVLTKKCVNFERFQNSMLAKIVQKETFASEKHVKYVHDLLTYLSSEGFLLDYPLRKEYTDLQGSLLKGRKLHF